MTVLVVCRRPGLLAAGLLGTIGAILDDPWVIPPQSAAVLLAAGAATWRIRHPCLPRTVVTPPRRA